MNAEAVLIRAAWRAVHIEQHDHRNFVIAIRETREERDAALAALPCLRDARIHPNYHNFQKDRRRRALPVLTRALAAPEGRSRLLMSRCLISSGG